MKKFEIGMIISAIDKVTGPAKGISASIRKMSAQAEKDTSHSSTKAGHHAKEHAKKHAHGIAGFFHEGMEKAFEFIPEVAAVAGVVGGIEGLVEGYKKLTEASDEAAAAQTRLTTMMMHVKGTTKEDIDGVNELADKLEGKTAYKHTIFEMAASQLAAFGMNGKQIKAMMPAMADYLAMQNGMGATNEDAIAGAKLLGKAYSGNVGALRRAGIVFTKAQEAILKTGTAAQRTAVLIKGIEGKGGGLAAKQLLDPKGQIQQANNIFEKVKEKFGAALTPVRLYAMHALSGALPYISKFADDFPKILSGAGGGLSKIGAALSAKFNEGFGGANIDTVSKSFETLGAMVMNIFGPVLPLVKEFIDFIAKEYGQRVKMMVDLWVKAQPGIKAIVEAFKPLIDVVANLWHKLLKPFWDSLLEPLLAWLLGSFAPFLINILGPAFKFLAKAIGWALNLIIDLIAGLFSGLGRIWGVVSKFFVNLWGRIKLGFNFLRTVLTSIWESIWGGLFKWVEDKWSGFLELFRKIGAYLGFGPDSSKPQSSYGSGGGTIGGNLAAMPRGLYGTPGQFVGQATVNGAIHVSHDPGLRVKVGGSILEQQLGTHLGIQGIH